MILDKSGALALLDILLRPINGREILGRFGQDKRLELLGNFGRVDHLIAAFSLRPMCRYQLNHALAGAFSLADGQVAQKPRLIPFAIWLKPQVDGPFSNLRQKIRGEFRLQKTLFEVQYLVAIPLWIKPERELTIAGRPETKFHFIAIIPGIILANHRINQPRVDAVLEHLLLDEPLFGHQLMAIGERLKGATAAALPRDFAPAKMAASRLDSHRGGLDIFGDMRDKDAFFSRLDLHPNMVTGEPFSNMKDVILRLFLRTHQSLERRGSHPIERQAVHIEVKMLAVARAMGKFNARIFHRLCVHNRGQNSEAMRRLQTPLLQKYFTIFDRIGLHIFVQ